MEQNHSHTISGVLIDTHVDNISWGQFGEPSIWVLIFYNNCGCRTLVISVFKVEHIFTSDSLLQWALLITYCRMMNLSLSNTCNVQLHCYNSNLRCTFSNKQSHSRRYIVRSSILPDGATQMDVEYMRLSLQLAKRALGHTSPNPMVGCVIVKDGKVVGQGFHPKAGEPHAEVSISI